MYAVKAKSKRWIGGITWFVLYIAGLLFISFQFALTVSKNKDRAVMKYKGYYLFLLDWLTNLENGRYISDFLEAKGYVNIAVYGGGYISEHLVTQLYRTNISVKYIIDKSIMKFTSYKVPIYSVNDNLPEVDAIIVTPIWDCENIRNELSHKVKYPIISMKDIIVRQKNE